MNDKNTEDKLKKLKKIEERYRLNSKRYLDKTKKEGKKQISAIITLSAYQEICKRREYSKLTAGQIIEQALKETTQYFK